jgi:hypothetical protein
MAEIFPDEGIDKAMGIFPKNGANLATLYMGIFTSQTPATVPARTATGGAVPAGWTEAAGAGYARIAVAAADWGALSTNGNGRKTTNLQKTYAAVGVGVNWGTANGFFLATHDSSQAGDTIIYFANFDSGLARALVEGVTEKVTPSMQFDG